MGTRIIPLTQVNGPFTFRRYRRMVEGEEEPLAMEKVASGEIAFAIHSAAASDDPHDTRVSAAVFATKLAGLVRALKAADIALNGATRFEYTIAKLHTSTPTAILREHAVTQVRAQSGIAGFNDCAVAIAAGESKVAKVYGECAVQIKRLASGAGKSFGYAEASVSNNVLRIDDFLRERATAVWAQAVEPEEQTWFKGKAHGEFVGAVEAVDLRGALPEVKLVLSAGGKQIDCVCRGLEVEEIRAALHRRVRLGGVAYYDGKSGLPRRLEVVRIEHFKEDADLSRWSGAFAPFEARDWDEGH